MILTTAQWIIFAVIGGGGLAVIAVVDALLERDRRKLTKLTKPTE